MRYLNKIVFINSAHVRYAEINLNGNVHLIGTQGVGKSTLLRALLFFYNADKQKLGIPKEKKSFDEFYFEKANSYIVYEVARDESAYCVLVKKSSGRACFHFVDAPYNRDFIIDENGNVATDSNKIRARLNEIFERPIYMSPIVDRYEQFRDIIYGNHQNVKKEFYKFSIAESPRYQNIPRSIQNVFLNSKLDADFIKDTIIQSMDSESAFIDLRYFRSQVSEFEQEYNDIGKWYEKNKKGECDTRVDADRVVKVYHTLFMLKKNVETFSKELNYAYRTTKEQLPSIGIEIEKVGSALNTTLRLIAEENGKFNKERDSIKSDLTLANDKLKKCKEKSEYYAAQNIETVLRNQEQEGVLKAEESSLEERRRILTREFEDIAEKFERLLNQVDAKLEEFRQIQNARINERESAFNEERQKLFAEYERNGVAIAKRFDEEIEDENAAKASLVTEKNDCEKSLAELKYFHPLESEILARKEQLQQTREKENSAKIKKAEAGQTLTKLLSEREAEIARNKSEFEKENQKIESERRQIAQQLEKLDSLLERQKGSLYQWLSENKPGWENSIGKVVDEESILYNTSLSPELDSADSLFGVKINLDELPIKIRTPEELQAEHKRLEQELANNKNAAEILLQELEKKNASIERSLGIKIRAAQDEIRNYEMELFQLPVLLKRLNNELENLKRRDAEEIQKRRDQLQQNLSGVSQKILASEEKLKKILTAKERELKQARKNYDANINELSLQLQNFKAQLQAEIIVKENESNEERSRIQKQKEAELESRNVDTAALRECEAAIAQVQAKLADIERHRELVTLYRRDKQEFFDCENEFKESKRNLEAKLNALQDKFDARRQKLEVQRREQGNALDNLQKRKSEMEKGLSETDKFAISSICPENIRDVGEAPNVKQCVDIIQELTAAIIDSQKRSKDLETSIHKFRGHFSARNTFKFPTELNSEQNYMSFAENLSDFLLNNKINDYRERTSGRYTEILTRIAREVGNMSRQKSEIEKIIGGVNRDFVEKNFAGVIKNIALRTEESNDKLMRLLESIQKFNAENQYKMGELNLFSDGDTEAVNRRAVELLLHFVKALRDEPNREQLKLSDAFRLQFRVQENDNDTGWIDKISNVGSEGTDVLVKAMVNIMLINVFKTQISRKFGDFKLHCMMDEIGRLHPTNANGILKFANQRNIYLVNGSPTTQSVSEYRYTYLLDKNNKSETLVRPLITKA